MSETLVRVLGCICIAGFGLVIALVCAYVMAKIYHNIKVWRRKYTLQHRFNKPPLAKCYCKDCVYRPYGELCDKFDCYVDQDFFCRHADPRDGK